VQLEVPVGGVVVGGGGGGGAGGGWQCLVLVRPWAQVVGRQPL